MEHLRLWADRRCLLADGIEHAVVGEQVDEPLRP